MKFQYCFFAIDLKERIDTRLHAHFRLGKVRVVGGDLLQGGARDIMG